MAFFAAVDDLVKGLREYLIEVGECGTDGSFEPFILHITAIFPPCQDRLGTSMRGKALKKEIWCSQVGKDVLGIHFRSRLQSRVRKRVF